MQGRQEEEMEKEEVERQLREVEMQEAGQREMEEGERLARLEGQRQMEERGDVVGGEQRDLDDDVPDAGGLEGDEDDDEEDEEDEEDEMGMEGDLDDEVPEAEEEWTYDTTREFSSETGALSPAVARVQLQNGRTVQYARPNLLHQATASTIVAPGQDENSESDLDGNVDYPQHNLDDDPDHPEHGFDDEAADLDDEIPDADADDPWEHTDTSLEESDMDISLLPSGITTTHSFPHSTTAMLPPQRPITSSSRPVTRHNPARASLTNTSTFSSSSAIRSVSGNSHNSNMHHRPPAVHQPISRQTEFTPHRFNPDLSISQLISTDNTTTSSYLSSAVGATNSHSHSNLIPNPNDRQRAWLDPSSARRNLFGVAGRNGNTSTNANRDANTSTMMNAGSGTGMALQAGQARNLRPTSISASQHHADAAAETRSYVSSSSNQQSSHGLFTPQPQTHPPTQNVVASSSNINNNNLDNNDNDTPLDPLRSRTRSGRVRNPVESLNSTRAQGRGRGTGRVGNHR